MPYAAIDAREDREFEAILLWNNFLSDINFEIEGMLEAQGKHHGDHEAILADIKSRCEKIIEIIEEAE